jgi:hypothetical protein
MTEEQKEAAKDGPFYFALDVATSLNDMMSYMSQREREAIVSQITEGFCVACMCKAGSDQCFCERDE